MVCLNEVISQIECFLDLSSYIKMCLVLRIKYDLYVEISSWYMKLVPFYNVFFARGSALIRFAPPCCGPQRLQLWKTLLNCGQEEPFQITCSLDDYNKLVVSLCG
jgi:hypothetical protein